MNETLTTGCRQQSEARTVETAFDPKTICTYPSHGTQAARLLAGLLAGRQIDPLLAWQDFGIYRTSDVVFRLRKLGWPVKTDDLAVNNRFGEECLVALYSLPADAIERAGTEAKDFITTERETLREMWRAA